MDVSAQDELRPRVGPEPALELEAVDQVAGVRQAGRGHPGRFGQEREVRRDDGEVRLSCPAAEPTDVLRRRRAAADADTAVTELERLLVEQPNPVLAGAVGELVAETKVVVAAHRRERSDVRCCQTGEHVLEIARIRELDDVSEQEDQIDPSLGEPRERRVRALGPGARARSR